MDNKKEQEDQSSDSDSSSDSESSEDEEEETSSSSDSDSSSEEEEKKSKKKRTKKKKISSKTKKRKKLLKKLKRKFFHFTDKKEKYKFSLSKDLTEWANEHIKTFTQDKTIEEKILLKNQVPKNILRDESIFMGIRDREMSGDRCLDLLWPR